MDIKFSDVHEAIQLTRQAVTDMGLDVDNALNGVGKCILTEEVQRLADSYKNLYNADITVDLDMTKIKADVKACMSCIDL